MKVQNSKSLFHFLIDQMEKLDNQEISIEQAKAQANLSKQVNNILKYELERTKIQIEVREFNMRTGANIEIREVEAKNFDNTIK